jgi:hypothetical protein
VRASAENPVTASDLHILVHEPAEPITPQGPHGWGVLTQRSVRLVDVVVPAAYLQHGGEVARPGDHEVVEAFVP